MSASLQDYSLIKTQVDTLRTQLALPDNVSAFYYFVVDSVLRLQEQEIDDSITDSNYLRLSGRAAGHDRGVDALYIDGNTSPSTVHIFNCKYTEAFEKLDSHFPATEIDKILSFFQALMSQDANLETDVNGALFAKVQEIWNLFRNEAPRFEVHLCSNLYQEIEQQENNRLKRALGNYSNIKLLYHLMPKFVLSLTRRDKVQVNARLRGDDHLQFEKTDGDIRALVTTVDAKNLLRIVCNDELLREDVDVADFSCLTTHGILKDAFEDNVRVYLQQSSKINRNIKETALSNLRGRFFYFNNGVTITCDRFSFNTIRHPIIELQNLQVVNGGQTIHALYDAFCQSPEQFDKIEVLCRIYETTNNELSSNIAEYTNSQNPVKSRDIRSNDYVQKKLESELLTLGYYYERKKGQHSDKPKNKRIDLEKAGQALMAFYGNMPSEAKDKKALIFAEKYEDIFSDEVTAGKVLLAVKLLDAVEQRKIKVRKDLLESPDKEKDAFVLHSNYYFLYAMRKLSLQEGIDREDFRAVMKFYGKAKALLRRSVRQEQKALKSHNERYSHRVFLKGNRPKQFIDSVLQS